MTEPTILWHDYETWGVNPRQDWPCQFAAIRTNLSLEPVGKPINWFCRIPNDQLPNPQACLITGITPQHSLRDGYIEAEFVQRIHAQMMQPNTCVSGYNSIRFDDEVSRFAFHRNFYDPYAREWQNGNSRWDIIDLVRACYALRPDGIEWPMREDGSPSFKLEHLSQANDLEHASAHDALSDVHATIEMAKLIKSKQEKLYAYAFSLRAKQQVIDKMNVSAMQPMVHISGMYKSAQGCCGIILPIGFHPKNPNAVVCINLLQPLEPLQQPDVELIRAALYAKTDELDSPDCRPGLKLIHVNKSPFIAPLNTLPKERAEQLNIDLEAALNRAQQVHQNAVDIQQLLNVFDSPQNFDTEPVDVDQSLYSDGFPSNEEKYWCQKVLNTAPGALHDLNHLAPSLRHQTKLFRYRARNFPESLTAKELEQWQQYRQDKLAGLDSTSGLTAEQFMRDIEVLHAQYQNDANKQAILRALIAYAQSL